MEAFGMVAPARNMPDFLEGGGAMGALMRSHDWSATPLGAPDTWPMALRTCLRILLASRQPMWVWWGDALINFYNDAYLPIIGAKHPAALGQPAVQVWSEIWDQIQDRVAAAMAGKASYAEAELLAMERFGAPEETYFTFSLSPVPDPAAGNGRIGGIICATVDDTQKVVGARRMVLLGDLASRTRDARTADDVYQLSAEALAGDPRDLPFALLYRFEPDGVTALLKGATGIAPGDAAAPLRLAPSENHPWPLAEVMRTGKARSLTGLDVKLPGLPTAPWDRAPTEALVLPLSLGTDTAARGILVAAISPYRMHGDGIEAFIALAAGQIASAIANVEAFEIEHERAKAADVLALEVEHRRRIEKQQNLLLDELNHRVKNTLATVQALAIQTLRGVDVPVRDTFIARLFALSSQHDLLTLDNWEGASLEGVLRRALRPWDQNADRLVTEGPPVHLTPKRALALGMAFHELASNAVHHGALSNADGKIRARWQILPDGQLHFSWEEEGGPKIAAPDRQGFGLRLIEHGVAREVSGKVEIGFPPEGMTCAWTMLL